MESNYVSESAAAHKRARVWKWGGRIATILFVVVCSDYFETIIDFFPALSNWRLQSYGWASRHNLRPSRKIDDHKKYAGQIIGVEIDEDTFFNFLHEDLYEGVTDRAFLATVIENAVRKNAAVIALDINLEGDAHDHNDECRTRENQALFNAISDAQAKHIPIVLASAFNESRPNIFDGELPSSNDRAAVLPTPVPADVPRYLDHTCNGPGGLTATNSVQPAHLTPEVKVAGCSHQQLSPSDSPVRAGFDYAPVDRRKVPLASDLSDSAHDETATNENCPSFALQVADAFQSATKTPREFERLTTNIAEHQFVYTIFLPDYSHLAGLSPRRDEYISFDHVSAKGVYNSSPDVLALLQGKIVLVGGHRRDIDKEGGRWIDYHGTPQGQMAGMYIHANYIAGLLADDVLRPTPRWLPVTLDPLIAIAIMTSVALWARSIWSKLGVLAVYAALVIPMFLIGTARGYFMDFFAVLFIMVLHTVLEHYFHLQEKAQEHA